MIKDERTRTAEHEFFAKRFGMSYSSLNKLVYAPALFYKDYVLKQRDDEVTTALLQGKVIHCLLLDDGSFDKQFILLPGTEPSDNVKKVIEAVYQHCVESTKDGAMCSGQLNSYSDIILKTMLDMKFHQSLTDDKKADKDGVMKTGDQKRVDKVVSDSTQEYFQFLFNRGDRDIVDIPTMDYCAQIVELLRENDAVKQILGLSGLEDHIQILNEVMMEADTFAAYKENPLPFGFKGILDSVKIDHQKKEIRITDLKTTSKAVTDFPEAVQFWNLWIQAVMYKNLVTQEFLLANEMDPKEWTIIFTFLVIDKYKQIYPFEVSPATMLQWEADFAVKIEEARWHFENQKFDLPFKFANSSILL